MAKSKDTATHKATAKPAAKHATKAEAKHPKHATKSAAKKAPLARHLDSNQAHRVEGLRGHATENDKENAPELAEGRQVSGPNAPGAEKLADPAGGKGKPDSISAPSHTAAHGTAHLPPRENYATGEGQRQLDRIRDRPGHVREGANRLEQSNQKKKRDGEVDLQAGANESPALRPNLIRHDTRSVQARLNALEDGFRLLAAKLHAKGIALDDLPPSAGVLSGAKARQG